MIEAAKDLLQGVGELPSRVEQCDLAIHYRRSLSVAEIALLDPFWCEIPAQDNAGTGMLLEENV